MIYPIRSIVAGIAELSEHEPVLGSAVELADRTGATLHLVHAYELPDLMWDAYARMGYMDGEALQQYSDGIRQHMELRVREITDSPHVHCHALAGPPAPMIEDVAQREEADLILVGATRRGAIARAMLGTTAQRVLRTGSAPAPAVRTELLRSLAEAGIERFLATRRLRAGQVEPVVRIGDPAREIVTEAAEWDADLLVVGTHGRPAPQRWILGSVAESAIRSTTANVLVIPAAVEARRTLPVPVTTHARPMVSVGAG